jgi:hypothetical protein
VFADEQNHDSLLVWETDGVIATLSVTQCRWRA